MVWIGGLDLGLDGCLLLAEGRWETTSFFGGKL